MSFLNMSREEQLRRIHSLLTKSNEFVECCLLDAIRREKAARLALALAIGFFSYFILKLIQIVQYFGE